ncbi:MAG TPA: CBS and ACT domain-containing protein [Methylomirabilota bacterium]|nr:CBS and ACT domain-containing protein [Methylomirabilota bacterium]
MLIRDVMQPRLVTVTPQATLAEAMRLVGERGIRHLPVVAGDELVGIVSDRDLKRAMASPATSLVRNELAYLLARVTVDEIMTRAVITISPSFAVEDAARLMVTEKISALPVTESGRLIGIVTETDILELFVRALGASEPSSRVDVMLADERSGLGGIVDAVEKAGAAISSIVTLRDPSGRREAILRVATIDPGRVVGALTAAGHSVRDGYRRPS